MKRYIPIFIIFCLGFGNKAKAAYNIDSLLVAYEADSIAEYYLSLNLLDSAISYKTKALSVFSRVYEKTDTLLTDYMYELALLFFDAQQYNSAILLFNEIEHLQKQYSLYDASGHSLILAHLSLAYAYVEAYSSAIQYCEELLSLKNENEDDVDFSHVEILDFLVNYYLADNKIYKALEKALDTLNKIDDEQSDNDIKKITTLQNIASCYFRLKDINLAIKFQNEALLLSQKLITKNEDQGIEGYYTSLYRLADIYAFTHNYQEAIRIVNQCISFCSEKMGRNDIRYAQALLLSARYNAETGNYGLATQLCKKAYDIHVVTAGRNDQYTLLAQLMYARCLACAGDNLGAISWGEDAISKYREIYDDTSAHVADALARLAEIYMIIGYYDLAIEKILFCIKNCKERSAIDTDMQYVLATCYALRGNYDDVIGVCESVLNNNESNYVDKAKFHALLAEGYFHQDNKNKVKEHIRIYMNSIMDSFTNKFTELPYASKKNFLDYYGRKMRTLLPQFALETKDQDIINYTYDFTALWYKGLLLRSDLEFRNAIYSTNNNEIINDYLSLNSNKYELFQYVGNDKNNSRIDTLTDIIEEQEMRILRKIDYKKTEIIDWQYIQTKLKENDLAIEFVSFPVAEGEKYIALTLKRGFNGPKCYELFVDSGDDIPIYKNRGFWNFLKEDLEGIENIYFSPTGIINNLGLEYFPIGDKQNIFESYNVYRVSSTSQINDKRENKISSAVLYGSLNYDLEPLIDNKIGSYSAKSLSCSLQDSLSCRNDFDPLYYTEEEISEIEKVLKENNIVYYNYSGNQGTEMSFRNLSGKEVSLIHIATHGMYIDQKDSTKKDINWFRFDQDVNSSFSEDRQMTHSFLVMSGGNLLPQKKAVPEGADDGILTAQEISLLDLRNLNIVSLSACQTALGMITTEGIIGLQRGFKKAGAKTILMSLDIVDDEATRILMVEFYKNLLGGKSQLDSLRDAQKYLRQVDNGKYDDPKYWAAFILLDGLD